MKKTILVLSCEHASSFIPKELLSLGLQDSPHSFKTCDPYAAELTQSIAKTLQCDYLLGEISRSILDLNKNHHQEHCFSLWSKTHLSEQNRQHLLDQHYFSFRTQFHKILDNHIQAGKQVLHLSIHTFNPQEITGVEHHAAIGILYDSLRHGEKEVARIWNELLCKRTPYRVRLNYPRSGKGDNFTSYLRKQYGEADYLGLELECNALLLENSTNYLAFTEDLCHSIFSLIEML